MASAKGARTAAVWGAGLLQDNQGKVLGELGQGYDTAQGYLGGAGDLYAGMAARGTGAVDRYDALSGGAGAAGQLAALQASPDYQFASDQGNQGLLRARAAQGMLASGNTDIDAMTFNQGLAAQQLGAARQAQIPLMNLYSQGINGQAGVFGTQAGAATDYYTGRANVLDGTTKDIVGLGSQALLAGDQAKSQNQANMINIGTGLLKGATSLFTGGLGGLGGGFTKVGG